MWGPGGYSCRIRFICHALIAMAAFGSDGNHDELVELPPDLFDVLPNGQTFLHGVRINAKVVSLILPRTSPRQPGY